ncbi:hypothetical protein AB4Z51_43560 [Bradyrhizobium sp. 2TAF36]|uniref:hypothetical protein n=1 Tax=Bradyrhizobium sp. 2TAF36 TaxID=3233016 RepID=UPI003F92792B
MTVRPIQPRYVKLAAQLADPCDALSPLESALLIVAAMREVNSGTWKIAADADGCFFIVTEG